MSCSKLTFDIYFLTYFFYNVPVRVLNEMAFVDRIQSVSCHADTCNNEQIFLLALSFHVFEVDPKLCDPIRMHVSIHFYQIFQLFKGAIRKAI